MSYRERLGRLPDFSMGTRFNPNALIAAGLPIAPIVEHGSWQTGEPDILRWDISRGVGQTPAPSTTPWWQPLLFGFAVGWAANNAVRAWMKHRR